MLWKHSILSLWWEIETAWPKMKLEIDTISLGCEFRWEADTVTVVSPLKSIREKDGNMNVQYLFNKRDRHDKLTNKTNIILQKSMFISNDLHEMWSVCVHSGVLWQYANRNDALFALHIRETWKETELFPLTVRLLSETQRHSQVHFQI